MGEMKLRRRCFLAVSLGLVVSTFPAAAFRIPLPFSTMSTAAAMTQQQFAPQAASLFNNMKTPASIIAGAMVPMGLLSPVPLRGEGDDPEGGLATFVRRSYTPVAVIALLSEFVSVVFATVAVNQLTETVVQPAASVWELIRRDYDLCWSGTNAHFVFGMFSFAYLVAAKSYFNLGGGPLGRGAAGLAASALLYMVGIVNRGVASGSGDGMSYGGSVLSLFRHYLALVLARRPGAGIRPMERGAVALMLASLITVVYGAMEKSAE